MGHHRLAWFVLIFLALGASGSSARAFQTPTYFVTEGTVFYTDALGDLAWSFSGPGVTVHGSTELSPGRVIDVGVTAGFVAGGAVVEGNNFGSGTVGGIFYPDILFTSSDFQIIGSAPLPNPPITIPDGSSFPVSGPAFFSGSLTACVKDGAPECIGPDIFIVTFNNTGIATFDLAGPFNPGSYAVIGESFTVTPEPTSALLFVTGLLMISLVVLRKHN
jgi:hypothetical protein